MDFAIKYIRPFILVSSIVASVLIYIYLKSSIDGSALNIQLSEIYGFLSIIFLFLALIHTPLYSNFSYLPFKALSLQARRAIGVSSFIFALLHSYFAFFFMLGGFEGLGFLNDKYLFSISLGFAALLILSVLTATSLDFAVIHLGSKWKLIHRLVYFASFAILIHMLMLGSHFTNINAYSTQIFLIALLLLAILEALRFDKYIKSKLSFLPKYFPISLFLIFIIIALIWYLYLPMNGINSGLQNISVHNSEHMDEQ